MNDVKSLSKPQSIEIREIIDQKRVVACFQQIVSVSRKKVSGFEGLIRGINPNSNALVSPLALFEAAKNENVTLELDRVCREKIIEDFSKIYQSNKNILLFLNFDASILNDTVGSDYLLNQVIQNNINPKNIVIEISERKVNGNAALKKFADTYRQYGFMLALDDVGTEFSNMDRILLIKPDIIKIDISIVKNIENDFYKQGVFRSLVILSNKIGAMIVAEGVENENEAIQVLRLGSHMIQGYYFSVPAELKEMSTDIYNGKIDLLGKRLSDYMRLQYSKEKNTSITLNRIVNKSVKKLLNVSSCDFDTILEEIIKENPSMECAYIMNYSGIQISQTVCSDNIVSPKNLIFYSATQGTDHSMEKYYYPLMSANLKKHMTEPYISLATGNLCITISSVFINRENNKYILCADFITFEDGYNFELKGPIDDIHTKSKLEIYQIINMMSEEINKDKLTDAYNRRYIEERLLYDILKSGADQPLSVLLVDIDCFKKINDIFGHLCGDNTLKEFVAITKNFIRKNEDWIARYGGDEFLIVLNGASKQVAQRVAEGIRRASETHIVYYRDSKINFTVSIGTYTSQSNKMTPEELIALADEKLYHAKNSGRNIAVS
ncbi:GGDEF domain-containing protein [Oscillospiraceae bacterium CM]|nr:GGDEF domain-containing protein [Oscillospiraceae bacterium CM]